MKTEWRRSARGLWTLLFVLSSVCLAVGQGSKKNSEFEPIQERDRDNPKAREQWFLRGRTAVNGVPAAALRFRAYQQKMQMRQQFFASRAVTAVPHVSSTGWVPLGPAPLASDPGTGQNYGWVSGRATAVAIDPADATGNTVFLGGAHGGVWKSANATAAVGSVVWSPVLDYEVTLAVGSIAIQPGNADVTKSVILVGTGEPNSSADSYYGLGILRSTNGGATWTQIGTADSGARSLAGLGFSKIAFSTANPQLVVAAAAGATEGFVLGLESSNGANRGIYYSQDAGVTWRYANVTDGSTTVAPGSVTSVVYNAVAGKFFAALRYHGIYSSTDGINWTRLADANQPGPAAVTLSACPTTTPSSACPFYRAELTVVPGRNEMYTWVVGIDNNTGLETDGGVWQNTSGGASPWKQIGDNGITSCGDNDGCGVQQGTYNLEIAALPNGSATDLYTGAINLFKCTITSPTASSPSCTFLNLTHVYGCYGIANVHPDQHHLAGIIAGGKELMYFANDGGVYRALDGYTGLTTGTCGGQNNFDDLNGTLGSMTQFVSFSEHPTDANTLLGGTQDNGSPATASGTTSTSWINVLGGDGGYNAISPANPTDWYTSNPDSPPMSQSLGINHCGSGINCNEFGFQQVVTSAQLGNDDGAFYFPYILDPQAPSELIVGTCRVWRGGPATSTSGTYSVLSNNFDTGINSLCDGTQVNLVRSLAAGGPKDANGFSKVVYAGTDGFGGQTTPPDGRLFVTTNAGTALMADRTGSINPNEYPISAIAIDPADTTGQTAYVAIMGFGGSHIFKTISAGVSWADFSGNLPNAPADALVIDSGTIYAGTDVGVFSSSTASANWTEVGPAQGPGISGFLPNVPVTALRLFNSGGKKLLRASTYGRGIWQYDLLAATTPDFSIAISDSPQTIFPGQSAIFHGKLTAVNSYASAVNLSCAAGTTGVPATCTPSPASVTPTGAGAAFTVTAGGTAQDYLFNVHAVGTDAGTTTHNAAVTLHVVDFTLGTPSPTSVSVQPGNTSAGVAFVVSGVGAFNSAVTLSCPATMPAGVTCNFSPGASVSALPTTVTLTFTATAGAALGTTGITISATTPGAPAPKTQSVSLTVAAPAPDYILAITNSPQSATVNHPATFTGTLKAVNGYASAVNLTCGTGAPPTCAIAPSSVTPTVAGASFTVTTQSNLAQTYIFNVNGAGTDAAHVAHVASGMFNSLFTFTISNSTGQVSLIAGQNANYTLLVTPVGSATFPGQVSVTCSGLPMAAKCSNPTVASGANGVQSVTLTITTAGPGKAAIRPIAQNRGASAPFLLWVSGVGIVVGGFARRPRRRTGRWIGLLLAMAGALTLLSCGGSGGGGGGGGGGGVSVSVSPPTASKFPSQTQQFSAAVSGSTNTAVTWQVNGATGGSAAAGTIDATGMYTAPAAVPSPATVTVSAVAQADVTKSGMAMMTIETPTPVGTYPITVTATAGNVVQTTTAVLVVQ
jgi:hypothetical protein